MVVVVFVFGVAVVVDVIAGVVFVFRVLSFHPFIQPWLGEVKSRPLVLVKVVSSLEVVEPCAKDPLRVATLS